MATWSRANRAVWGARPSNAACTGSAPPMSETVDVRQFTGEWDYASLPANIRLGADCFLERRESFGRFRSTRNPGLALGDRVRILTWTTFNVEPSGSVEIGADTLLVGPVFMCAEEIRIGARCILSYNV